MAQLILQQDVSTPAARFTGDTAYLRIYASCDFYSSTGVTVVGGQVGGQYWYQQYTCPITDGLILIPEVTLQTTTDSNVPNATYTAVFYDQAGRQQNTKLGNFFVDPQYLQSDVISNIIVSGAGTDAANGTYTYRGQHNTRNYWNLFGQADSTTDYAIVWDGAAWLMTDLNGDTLYTIDTSSQYPWDSLWTIATGNVGAYAAPAVAQSSIVVAATWAELTISNQGHPITFWDRSTWDVQQIKQYINLLSQNGVPYASKIVAGISYLTRDPALSTAPRAVASNDYTWEAINQTIYLDGETYQGDLAAAVAGIGDDVVELCISSNTTVTDDLEIPSNIAITREGQGTITVQATKTVTIANMPPTGNDQFFYGDGRVILGPNATNGSEIPVSLWVGIENHNDITFQVQQAFDSASNNVNPLSSRGAIVRYGTGTWNHDEIVWPNLVTIAGAGNSIDGGAYSTPDVGTTIRLVSLDADCLFRLPSQYYGQRMHGVTLSSGDSLTANCVLGEGDLYSGLGSSFVNVTFQATLGAVGGDPGNGPTLVKFHYTNVNNAEFVGNKFTQCWWQVPEASIGFSCDSINTLFSFDTCQFQVAKKGIGKDITRLGWFFENNPDNAGINTYNFTKTFERNISSATITQNGSSYSSTMVLDPTTPLNKQFKESDAGEPITCGGFTAYPQRFIDPFTAIMSFHPDATITAQPAVVYRWDDFEDTAYAAYHLDEGAISQFQVIGGADEGYNYSAIINTSSLISNVVFTNYLCQGRIRFTGAAKATFNSCVLSSCAFEDNTSAEDIVVSMNDCGWNIYTPFQSYLLTTQAWRSYDASTRRILESGVQPYYSDNTGTGTYIYPYMNRHGVPTKYIGPSYSGATDPMVQVGSIESNTDAPHIRVGRLTKTVPTEQWLYYYDLTRSNADGFLYFTGNQSGFRKYVFDDEVDAPAAAIPVITSTTSVTSTGYVKGTAKGSTKGVGYGPGAGDTATQATSRTTTVTINAMCGYITTSGVGSIPSIATAEFPWVDFRVTNNCCEAYDRVILGLQGSASLCVPSCIETGTGYFVVRLTNQSKSTADTAADFVSFAIIKGAPN